MSALTNAFSASLVVNLWLLLCVRQVYLYSWIVDEEGCGLWESSAKAGRAPWYVKIFSQNESEVLEEYCPGTLISSYVVLADADCMSDPPEVSLPSNNKVFTGSDDTTMDQSSEVVSIHIHPSYVNGTKKYNLALIVLATPIITSTRVRPICVDLRDEGLNERLLAAGKLVREYSWVSNYTTTLLSDEECRKNLADINAFSSYTNISICAVGERKCVQNMAVSNNAEDGSKRWYYLGFRSVCYRPQLHVFVSLYRVREWIWSTLPCGIPLGAPCPLLYKFHSKAADLATAMEECSKEGGTLPAPATVGEYAELVYKFKKRRAGYGIWLAITDRDTEGTFTSLKDPSSAIFTNWHTNEPNNGAAKMEENCVTMRFDGTYNDVACNDFNPYFCTEPHNLSQPSFFVESSDLTELLNIFSPAFAPPLPHYDYSPATKMYHRFYETPKSYAEALLSCLSEGSEMPVPYTEEEALEILRYTPQGIETLWLGITDIQHEGEFKSFNGSAIRYTDWDLGEPNNLKSDENCAILKYNGKYNDVHCNAKHPYICVKRYVTRNQHTGPGGCRLRDLLTVDYTCFDSNGYSVECGERVESGTKVHYQCKPYHVDLTTNYQLVCEEGGAFNAPTPRCVPDCGTEPARGLANVFGGQPTPPGTFPWHVGIYWREKEEGELELACGGTLVRRHLVISAAHCFTNRETLYPVNTFAVAAGKIYRDWSHPEDSSPFVQKSTVKQILIPNTYHGRSTYFQSDIAIVELLTPLNFSENVHAACLDLRNERLNMIHLGRGSYGKVAGWGITGNGEELSNTLQTLTVPFIEYPECFREVEKYGFGKYVNLDKICAGYTNGSGVCKGDSGGGLVFPHKETSLSVERYYLRGVVSTSPTRENTCRRDTYAAYMNVFYIKDWLVQTFRSLNIFI